MDRSKRPKPIVLAILDGWGVAPAGPGNAISQARTNFFNDAINNYPVTTLEASSEAVGLPWGEMGNSEVGHMTIGSGRILYQDFPRITKAIWDKSFFENQAIIGAFKNVKRKGSKLHLMGLLSSGGVHSYIEHLYALIDFAKKNGVEELYIHVILDGRDTPFNSGMNFVKRLNERTSRIGLGKIATVAGRYYSMDRDNNWDRIEKAYYAMTEGRSEHHFADPLQAIDQFYKKKIFDEEIPPVVITENNKPVAVIGNNDSIIFFNFRSDRARQLTKAFVVPSFERFNRTEYLKDLYYVSLTEYDRDLPVEVAFPSIIIDSPLAKVISDNGLNQLHIAETEKYAHVTYFFNADREEPFKGEDHILIPSPSVSNYDEKPEMSALELTQRVIKEIERDYYDFIVINYANSDMVGHTGQMKQAIQAIETVDRCLGELAETIRSKSGAMVITADHGNAEIMLNQDTGHLDKEHSTNPVPFILVDESYKGVSFPGAENHLGDPSKIIPQGVLSAFYLMGIWTQSLLNFGFRSRPMVRSREVRPK